MNTLNKIKILSQQEAIKIAAGEVVERPVNIIKEVIENSIDAQATKITIVIHQAGKELIKIIDNGIGMTPDDAKLSVAQHATSKITTVEDLDKIVTFGFRGEALASINSVSNVAITTKTSCAQTGTKIAWSFGKLQEESLQSYPTGTTLEIANLFDNIPARKKFLKKDETEWRAIVTLFQAFCFDYHNIHFQLYNENKLHFNCPPVQELSDRAAQLFDNNLHDKIVPLKNLHNSLCSVTGIISQPTHYRYDRNQIFIFVNNRWVKNIDLTKAIMRGYAGTLPPQKFPTAVIFIAIDQDQVDVNIHPKKEEVKFLHPKKVETVIVNSIKATFEQTVSQELTTDTQIKFPETFRRPASFSFLESKIESNYQPQIQQVYQHKNYEPSTFIAREHTTTEKNESLEKRIELPTFAAHAFEQPVSVPTPQKSQQEEQVKIVADNDNDQNVSIIGQYTSTYILFEKNNNLVFIDQHAAHERILYEQFKKNFKDTATIQLMFPEFIKLQAHDIITITPYLSMLKNHGITAEIFSETQLIIQTTPIHLKNNLLQETIKEILGWIHNLDETDSSRITTILNEKIHTKMACSAAIKAGEKLNHQQMQQLLKDLNATEHRFSCPHGRPTFWVLPIDQIEKQFKRDYGKKSEQFYDFL